MRAECFGADAVRCLSQTIPKHPWTQAVAIEDQLLKMMALLREFGVGFDEEVHVAIENMPVGEAFLGNILSPRSATARHWSRKMTKYLRN